MVDTRLHPDLAALLEAQGWTALTDAQDQAMATLLTGKHGLLMAPTGHGKTEAALLPVLSRLLTQRDSEAWEEGFHVLYITPLRALNRDLMQRLESWATALRIRIGVRHGDTPQSERARQARRPPEILITTPETLQLLLYGDKLRRHLRTVQAVIVDEVHDLALSERGAQLSVALERLEEVVAQPEELRYAGAPERFCPPAPHGGSGFQRVGLSATVADADDAARLLAGARPVERIDVEARKEVQVRVTVPGITDDDRELAAEMSVPTTVAAQLRVVRALVADHDRVIVFHNTRDGAELLSSRSALLDEGEPLLGLHHGSLSPEHRADVEDRFKAGHIKALVATSSLELGIDVGAIDHVVQVQSPRSVARLLQRLGRAGHRVGAVSAGTMVASGPEDALECMAVAAAAMEGRLEPAEGRRSPLVVLANQLVALTNEYAELDPSWAFQVIRRAGPFTDLDEGLFEAVWRALIELKTLYPSEERPTRMGRSGRARRHFLDHIGLIPDEKTYRIIDESTKRGVGTVDDAFVAAGLHPGALFVMAGRSWQVLEIETEHQRVRVAPAKELGAVPQWTGSQLPVSAMVARDVARLRGRVANGDTADLPADARAVQTALDPIQAHKDAGLEVPTDTTVTIERGRGDIIVNVALGTKGNEALGRITQALLHQRLGAAVGLETDAYRLHLTLPPGADPTDLEDLWSSLDPGTLDLLIGAVLRESPVLRHHLVHVAKHFGALPGSVDPNRFSRAKLDALMADMALHEETLDRLIHDRFDLATVAQWLHEVRSGAIRFVHQGMGPLSVLGRDETKAMMAAPVANEALLAKVRERIEGSDILLACANCQHHWDEVAADAPPRPRCRRCGSHLVACLRPWHKDSLRLLKPAAPGTTRSKEDELEHKRMLRNAQLVSSFGRSACLALVGRGVGADTAARILQKTSDPEDPHFWREILAAELHFARTNAFWRR